MPLAFLLVPYFTDRQRLMRIPIVTVSLMVVCVLVFLVTWSRQLRAEDEFLVALNRAVELAWGQETLDTGPLQELCAGFGEPDCLDTDLGLPEWAGSEDISLMIEDLMSGFGMDQPEPGSVDQQELDAAVTAAREAWERQPFVSMGLVRGRITAHGPFTYAFLHGGWMHLLGNLLFLWLAASSIEHVWNRGFLVGFYLAGAAIAGGFQMLFMGDIPLIPLVGASGSVAALMGAYLLLFAKSRIKIWYLFWFLLMFRSGTFFAPAWLALPLWFFWQVFLMAMGAGMGDQVAYAAHVGGFAGGFAIAFVVMKLQPAWLLAPTSEETAIDAAMGRGDLREGAELRSEIVAAGRRQHQGPPSADPPAAPHAPRGAPAQLDPGGAPASAMAAGAAVAAGRRPAAPPAAPTDPVHVRLASVTRVKDDHIGFEDSAGTPFRVSVPDITHWAVGRLAYRDAAGKTHESMVCDLIVGVEHQGDRRTVQAVRLLSDQQPYAILLKTVREHPAANFEQLMARIGKRLGNARYAIRPPPRTMADVPRFDHVDAFEGRWMRLVREEG